MKFIDNNVVKISTFTIKLGTLTKFMFIISHRITSITNTQYMSNIEFIKLDVYIKVMFLFNILMIPNVIPINEVITGNMNVNRISLIMYDSPALVLHNSKLLLLINISATTMATNDKINVIVKLIIYKLLLLFFINTPFYSFPLLRQLHYIILFCFFNFYILILVCFFIYFAQ